MKTKGQRLVNKIKVPCAVCGKTKELWPAALKKRSAPCCSRACLGISQKRRAAIVCRMCGKTREVRPSEAKKISICSPECRKLSWIGEYNHNYRGGTAHRERGDLDRSWRNKIFERDNYTCQMCNKRGGDLEAHHKLPWKLFPRLRFRIENGLTLCKPCHKTTYKEYYKIRKILSA